MINKPDLIAYEMPVHDVQIVHLEQIIAVRVPSYRTTTALTVSDPLFRVGEAERKDVGEDEED